MDGKNKTKMNISNVSVNIDVRFIDDYGFITAHFSASVELSRYTTPTDASLNKYCEVKCLFSYFCSNVVIRDKWIDNVVLEIVTSYIRCESE